jgi:hypothetical protein
MVNHIRRHIPNFVDIDPKPEDTEEFNTLDDLLKTKIVSRFQGYALAVSSHTYPSRPELTSHLLIGVKTDGDYWLVIGHLENPDIPGLSKWIAHKMPDNLVVV